MSVSAFQLLAENEGTKFVFGLIVFVIWAISASISAMNKQREQQRRQNVREQLLHGVPTPATVVLTPGIAMRIPNPPRKPKLAKRGAAPGPRPPVAPLEPPVPHLKRTLTETPTTAEQARPTPSATAITVSRWLRPQTLRQQFILTEVFQPPLALRPDR
ncbi:MAG: hypothetical protein ACREJC_15530 [Tepidisphaeraceae bacterium]